MVVQVRPGILYDIMEAGVLCCEPRDSAEPSKNKFLCLVQRFNGLSRTSKHQMQLW